MATSELSCQVSEENQERREAFWAEWKDLVERANIRVVGLSYVLQDMLVITKV